MTFYSSIKTKINIYCNSVYCSSNISFLHSKLTARPHLYSTIYQKFHCTIDDVPCMSYSPNTYLLDRANLVFDL